MSGYKIIKSGHIIEVYKYQHTNLNPQKEKKDDEKVGGRKKDGEEIIEERKDEYRKTVNTRARNNLRRLITANFSNGDIFLTLTFKDNITDIEYANYELKKFVQKLQRRCKKLEVNFKYVAVIEFQKRGAIHYHMICNLPVTWENTEERKEKERQLAKVWSHGFVNFKDISNLDNTGAYLIKYMTKENDTRLEGKKRYFHTRNMIKPKELKGEEMRSYIETTEGMTPVHTSSYFSKFTGKVEYKEYNPQRWS